MTDTTAVDLRTPAQIAAAETLARTQALQRVAADQLFGTTGKLLPRGLFDGGVPPVFDASNRFAERETSTIQSAMGWVRSTTDALEIQPGTARTRQKNAQSFLEWLTLFEGATWSERWIASGMDSAPRQGIEALGEKLGVRRSEAAGGVSIAVTSRLIRPSYEWMQYSASWKAGIGTGAFLRLDDPGSAERLWSFENFRAANPHARSMANAALSKMVLRNAKVLAELTADDLLEYAQLSKVSRSRSGETLAWELMVELGPLKDAAPTLKVAWARALGNKQLSVEHLVDRYGIPKDGVRDLLIDYLSELKANMDYGSLESMAYRLVRVFWREVVAINPDQADLRLAPDVALQWRERVGFNLDGSTREDKSSVYFAVRGLYRDLAEWSHEEPERWAFWVAPSPLPRSESRAESKRRRRVQSRIQDRTRSLTPLLPALRHAARDRRLAGARLLEETQRHAHGEEFEVDGCIYRRHDPPARGPARSNIWADLIAVGSEGSQFGEAGQRVDVTSKEADSFWGWAIIEVLKETGIRSEELQELTQLSIRHYKAQSTGTIVPLLHIAPSKNDRERLIPMTPELVQTLVTIQRRVRGTGTTVPLSVRYDHIERTYGEALPHLFARRHGGAQSVYSPNYIRDRLLETAAWAGITDNGQPIHFTPHDFRRLFATELVAAGLPMHIVASLMGHLNLETTRGYTAVFPEQVIAAHQQFIERRRDLRPEDEYREASAEEWKEFEEHFLLRKVALGDCFRPYATPCIHEHACAKCQYLRVDVAAAPRIDEMVENHEERIVEAREKVWLGEVAGLEESLKHLRRRQVEVRDIITNGSPPSDVLP